MEICILGALHGTTIWVSGLVGYMKFGAEVGLREGMQGLLIRKIIGIHSSTLSWVAVKELNVNSSNMETPVYIVYTQTMVS